MPKLKVDCVLFIVRDNDRFESITVYRPYFGPSDRAFCHSHWGPVDIAYRYGSSYLHLERKNSGIYTGIALPGEEFMVLDYSDAIALADRMRKPAVDLHVNWQEEARFWLVTENRRIDGETEQHGDSEDFRRKKEALDEAVSRGKFYLSQGTASTVTIFVNGSEHRIMQ